MRSAVQRRYTWFHGLWVLAGLAPAACGEDGGRPSEASPTPPGAACVPNETGPCACPDGAAGVSICEADGRFGACRCADLGVPPGADGLPPTGGTLATTDAAGPRDADGPTFDAGESDARPVPERDAAPPPDFAACLETNPDAKSCKDCCDCLPGIVCDDATACRQACDASPAEHWQALADRPAFVPEVVLGADGDFDLCLAAGSEQDCKVCCCALDLVCGDERFCRDACDAHDFSASPAPEAAISRGNVPPTGGGGAACEPTEDRFLDGRYGEVVVDGRVFTVPSPVTEMASCHDLYNPCAGGAIAEPEAGLQTVVIDDGPEAVTVTGALYADNDFELWVNGRPVCRDAVDYVPFNAHLVRFRASPPLTIAVNLTDAEELLGVGVERETAVGDGGFVARFVDEAGEVVAETGAAWRCLPLYIAPMDDPACLRGADSAACPAPTCPSDGDVSDCFAAHFVEPAGWTGAGFDDATWPAASVYATAEVAPKPAYSVNAARFGDAGFIWSRNLDLDNRVLCRWSGEGGGAPAGDAAARCAAIRDSVTAAGFAAAVSVECDGAHAWLGSDIFPDHDLMNGIVGTNEQIPVPADYRAPVALSPRRAPAPTTIDGALGVAVNGVPIFDYSSQGELDLMRYDPATDVVVQGQLDVCNGHAGRGDDYHYHAAPICMMAVMENAGNAAILGWGFDGYPLFGDRQPDGRPIEAGMLDLCHGMPDEVYGYRYHTSPEPPYVFQCLSGEVDLELLPRVSPPVNPVTNERRATGRPPQGGVDALRFERDGRGGATMTYSYRGEAYHITYTPTGRPGCYQFDTRTVTSGVVQMEYCRE